MKQMRSALLIIALLLLAAALLALFSPMLFRKSGKNILPETQGLPERTLTAKGVVESIEDIEISSQTAGIIMEIRAKDGDPVKKGQQLVVLDKTKVLAQLGQAKAKTSEAGSRLREIRSGYRTEDVQIASARARRAETVYNQAKDEFLRQDRLYKKDAVTLVDRDRALERMKVAANEMNDAKANMQKFQRGERKEEIEQATAGYARAISEEKYYEALLKDFVILSPIDGIVTEHMKEAGETVDKGTPVMRLINPDKMRIRAELEETDVGKAVDGQRVDVFSDTFKGKVFHGKIYKVFPYVKKKTQKTFDPRASFDINTQTLYIQLDDFTGLQNGMTVTVRLMK